MDTMRLVTRADFDGLACAVLLSQAGLMDDLLFVHPKDVRDGRHFADSNDMVCGVPHIPGCGYWFNHHSSEIFSLPDAPSFQGTVQPAPSCARLLWDHLGGEDHFGSVTGEMLRYVDKVESGDLNLTEILHPGGWVLLGFLLDPCTGLAGGKGFSTPHAQCLETLVHLVGSIPVAEILQQRDMAQRVKRYFASEASFRSMLLEKIVVRENVLILDARALDDPPPGNRFTMYSLYPECDASIEVRRAVDQNETVITVSHSILNRTCVTDVGKLMLDFGGWGHPRTGTCHVPEPRTENMLATLLQELRATQPPPSPDEEPDSAAQRTAKRRAARAKHKNTAAPSAESART